MYKRLENDTWEIFNKEIKGKKVIIWGAGQHCIEKLSLWKRVYDIAYIVDNDQKKWGCLIEDIQIFSPQKILYESKDSFAILICGLYAGSVAIDCEKMGITNYFSEFWMDNYLLSQISRVQKNIPEEKIKNIVSFLADEKSKNIFMKIIQKRTTGRCDYSDIGEGNEYFREDLFNWTKDEVYIDAGAYDGDSILEFIKRNNEFKRIYAFEPDKNNFNLIKKSYIYQAYKNKIEIYNNGIWNENTVLKFDGNKKFSSKVVCDNDDSKFINSSIECLALDEIIKEPVTFIKMDIEGSELKALKGAKTIITQYKPKLAICLYHKESDLWEIPEFIHSLVPEYKIYIRHHGVLYVDTVLYATV